MVNYIKAVGLIRLIQQIDCQEHLKLRKRLIMNVIHSRFMIGTANIWQE